MGVLRRNHLHRCHLGFAVVAAVLVAGASTVVDSKAKVSPDKINSSPPRRMDLHRQQLAITNPVGDAAVLPELVADRAVSISKLTNCNLLSSTSATSPPDSFTDSATIRDITSTAATPRQTASTQRCFLPRRTCSKPSPGYEEALLVSSGDCKKFILGSSELSSPASFSILPKPSLCEVLSSGGQASVTPLISPAGVLLSFFIEVVIQL